MLDSLDCLLVLLDSRGLGLLLFALFIHAFLRSLRHEGPELRKIFHDLILAHQVSYIQNMKKYTSNTTIYTLSVLKKSFALLHYNYIKDHVNFYMSVRGASDDTDPLLSERNKAGSTSLPINGFSRAGSTRPGTPRTVVPSADGQTEKEDESISIETLIIRAVTEFGAVLFQLVCFSRLGAKDYYYLVNQKADFAEYDSQVEPSLAANFVLFVTFIIFQFPYLNGYILLMFDTCVTGRSSVQRKACCLFITAIQILAVVVVWGIIRAAQEHWKGTITWIVPQVKATDDGRNWGAEFVEEWFAVWALMVGFIHLTFLNNAGLFCAQTHLFSEFSSQVKELPIPMTFIVQLTLLVAGLLRAFPTSHLSPHISCYIMAMGYTTWGAFFTRMAGGVAGYISAYLWYWYVYVPRHDSLRSKYPEYKYTKHIITNVYKAKPERSDAFLDNTFAISFQDTRHFYTR